MPHCASDAPLYAFAHMPRDRGAFSLPRRQGRSGPARSAGARHRLAPETDHGPVTCSRPDHFALAAASFAVFLHSDMNFLRSLPWRLLVSASFEHSSDAAVRAFFSAGAIGVVFAVGAGAAGGVVCANAALIKNREAKAVAATRDDMVIMENTSG